MFSFIKLTYNHLIIIVSNVKTEFTLLEHVDNVYYKRFKIILILSYLKIVLYKKII